MTPNGPLAPVISPNRLPTCFILCRSIPSTFFARSPSLAIVPALLLKPSVIVLARPAGNALANRGVPALNRLVAASSLPAKLPALASALPVLISDLIAGRFCLTKAVPLANPPVSKPNLPARSSILL